MTKTKGNNVNIKQFKALQDKYDSEDEKKFERLTHIAKISRNTSGIDAGLIDYELMLGKVLQLDAKDKQDLCNTAFTLYESICDITKTRAKNDKFTTRGGS